MKILVVGGSGLIGGTIALHLNSRGLDVTVMSRKTSRTEALRSLKHIAVDYVNYEDSAEAIAGFDGVIFAAAGDIRGYTALNGETETQYYQRVNDAAVPKFIKYLRDTGLSRAVYISSFYPNVVPEFVGSSPYVSSRHATDQSVRALANENFEVCSLGVPYVVGEIPGMEVPYLDAIRNYLVEADRTGEVIAPSGGTNFVAVQSVAEATYGALLRGESGKNYLIGDANYSWKYFLEVWMQCFGLATPITVKNTEHALFPSSIMYAGVGATVAYRTDGVEDRLLDYRKSRVIPTIKAMVDGSGQ